MMDFATEHRLPSVNAYRELVEAQRSTLLTMKERRFDILPECRRPTRGA
jgi:hypothetical protein